MMLPVLTHHIRYHQCLMHLDKLIGYVFKERCLLQVRHGGFTASSSDRHSQKSGNPAPSSVGGVVSSGCRSLLCSDMQGGSISLITEPGPPLQRRFRWKPRSETNKGLPVL